MRIQYTTLLPALVAVALVGCQTAPNHAPSKRDLTGLPATDFVVTVACSSPEMAFTGTIITDADEQQVSGVGDATYQISARHLVCSFRKLGADGSLKLTVSEPAVGESSSATSAGKHSLGGRADVLRTPTAKHTVVTTF
jgi:hypothetical protein